MKVKNSLKIFVVLLVMFAMFIICDNAVFATEISNEDLQNILDKIPNTIESNEILNSPADYWEWTMVAEREVKSIVGDIQGVRLEVGFVSNSNTGIIDLSKANVSFYDSSSNKVLKNKVITIKCANWNENNKKHIEEKLNVLNLKNEDYYISAELDLSKNEDSETFFSRVSQNHFNKLLNDSSIKCTLGSSAGEWGDGVYECSLGQMFFSMDNVMYYMYNNVSVKGIPTENKEPDLIQKTDNKTNVILDTDTNIVPSDTVLEVTEIKDKQLYTTITESLKNVSNKFVAYDITLKSKGVEIQPNGNVKISIPIPSEFNKSQLVAYRIDESGKKIEYTVKVNGEYAIIETDHFSTYVLGEMQKESNQESNQENSNTNKEKDDTPKTGTVEYTFVAGIVLLLSVTGLIILKKKQN